MSCGLYGNDGVLKPSGWLSVGSMFGTGFYLGLLDGGSFS